MFPISLWNKKDQCNGFKIDFLYFWNIYDEHKHSSLTVYHHILHRCSSFKATVYILSDLQSVYIQLSYFSRDDKVICVSISICPPLRHHN